jgi:NitT/TauT family transport system substrate-binding protein
LSRLSRLLRVTGALLAILLVLTSCGTAAPPSTGTATNAPPVKLSVGFTSLSGTQLPIWVAKDRGFFEQNGLDVELQNLPNGQVATAAMLAGQIQAMQIAIEPIQVGLTGEADMIYIIAPQTVMFFRLFTLPSIKDPSELKGKVVGITALGSVTNTAAKMALRSLGLNPEKDVQIVAANTIPGVLAALQSGGIQAGILSSPTTIRAREAGMKEVADVSKLGAFVTAWHVMSRKYMDANPDVVRRYTKSIVQAIAFEIQRPEETQQILGKYVSITDAAILKESYNELVPFLRRVPSPDLKSVQAVLDEFASTVPAAKTADPARFIDMRFVKELEDSGFIASLYPK